eukprot:m.48909 g.48909  ORF g.48909 m.48909 type:complete len:1018 (+) comp6068_c0_seq2:3-3056(+)
MLRLASIGFAGACRVADALRTHGHCGSRSISAIASAARAQHAYQARAGIPIGQLAPLIRHYARVDPTLLADVAQTLQQRPGIGSEQGWAELLRAHLLRWDVERGGALLDGLTAGERSAVITQMLATSASASEASEVAAALALCYKDAHQLEMPEKLLMDLVAHNKITEAVSFLCSLAAAGQPVSGAACDAILAACSSAPVTAITPTQASAMLVRLESAVQACSLMEHDLARAADRTIEQAARLVIASGGNTTCYAGAARIAMTCMGAVENAQDLFHRSTSVRMRDMRFSLLLSACTLAQDGESLLAGLQRASAASATLSEAAVGDCFAWMASAGLTDQFATLMAATHSTNLTPALLSGLFSACKDRGDSTTALSLLELVHKYRIGTASERAAWRSACAMMCGPEQLSELGAALLATFTTTFDYTQPQQEALGPPGLQHAHTLLSRPAFAHVVLCLLRTNPAAAESLYISAARNPTGNVALGDGFSSLLAGLARSPVFPRSLATRVAADYHASPSLPTAELAAALVLIAARSLDATAWEPHDDDVIWAPVKLMRAPDEAPVEADPKRARPCTSHELTFALIAAWSAALPELHVLGNVVRLVMEEAINHRIVFEKAVDLITSTALPPHHANSDHPIGRLHIAALAAGAPMLSQTHTKVLSTLSRAGNIQLVNRSFLAMRERSAQPSKQAFTAVTDAFARHGNLEGAWRVLRQMKLVGVQVDTAAYNAVLKAVASPRDLARIPELLTAMRHDGCTPNEITYSTIATKQLRHRRADEALATLRQLRAEGAALTPKSARLWLRALEQAHADFSEILDIHHQIRALGIAPDPDYLATLLHVCARRIRAAVDDNMRRLSAVYPSRCVPEGSVERPAKLGLEAFYELRQAAALVPPVSFEEALEICEATGDAAFALSVRDAMRASKEKPSYRALLGLIGALGNGKSFIEMDAVLDEFRVHGLSAGIDVITKLIYYHGAAGDIDGAMVIYDRMLELGLSPDTVLNRVLVSVCNVDPLSVIWNARPA